MYQVVVRLSLDSDTKSRVRNVVAPMLKACGLNNRGTGQWKGQVVSQALATHQLANVLDVLSNPHQVPNANIDVELDHIWIHIDRVA